MWLVIKNKELVLDGIVAPKKWLTIDRKVESLDDVKSGEMFIKYNIKK